MPPFSVPISLAVVFYVGSSDSWSQVRISIPSQYSYSIEKSISIALPSSTFHNHHISKAPISTGSQGLPLAYRSFSACRETLCTFAKSEEITTGVAGAILLVVTQYIPFHMAPSCTSSICNIEETRLPSTSFFSNIAQPFCSRFVFVASHSRHLRYPLRSYLVSSDGQLSRILPGS